MIDLEKISTGLLALAVTILAISYIVAGPWQAAVIALLTGILWWFSTRKLSWHWGASAGMAFLVVTAGVGTWLGLPFFGMLAAIMLAVSAWDLDAFVERLGAMVPDDAVRMLARSHLRRLLFVDGIALALVAISLTVELRFSFLVTFLLGLGMAFGLNRFLASIRGNARQKEN